MRSLLVLVCVLTALLQVLLVHAEFRIHQRATFDGTRPTYHPLVPETFSARVEVTISELSLDSSTPRITRGHGEWAANPAAGLGARFIQTTTAHMISGGNVHRMDLGAVFRTTGEGNNTKCVREPAGAHFPHPWNWLKSTEYEGKVEYNGQSLDVWGTTIAGTAMSIVLHDAHTPAVYFEKHEDSRSVVYEFTSFKAHVPDPAYFDYPIDCGVEKPITSIDSTARQYYPYQEGITIANASVSDASPNDGVCQITPQQVPPGCDAYVSACIAGRHFLSIFCQCTQYWSKAYRCLPDKFCGHD